MTPAQFDQHEPSAVAPSHLLRLVADDLTGALDTAAQFASKSKPMTVVWSDPATLDEQSAVGVDTGCRDLDAAAAQARFTQALDVLAQGPRFISFLKIDSLLRGHAADEISACVARWPDRAIIVAPAFPQQSRATRNGRQYVLDAGGAHLVGEDVGAVLRSRGITHAHRRAGEEVPRGVSLWDAETDGDLASIVDAGAKFGRPILWCGSAGLGAALSHHYAFGNRHNRISIAQPLLGIFGTDHPVMRRQLAAVAPAVTEIACATDIAMTTSALKRHWDDVRLLTFAVPPDTSRSEAHRMIERQIAGILGDVPRPATLLVSGGETLRSVCNALGAGALIVDGQIEPGVPASILRDGPWKNVRVISKSGAFGAPDFLTRLHAQLKSSQTKETT